MGDSAGERFVNGRSQRRAGESDIRTLQRAFCIWTLQGPRTRVMLLGWGVL